MYRFTSLIALFSILAACFLPLFSGDRTVGIFVGDMMMPELLGPLAPLIIACAIGGFAGQGFGRLRAFFMLVFAGGGTVFLAAALKGQGSTIWEVAGPALYILSAAHAVAICVSLAALVRPRRITHAQPSPPPVAVGGPQVAAPFGQPPV